MRIGELGRRTGVPTKTIRYYEGIGLLAEPERAYNGYRDYHDDAVSRLRFIRDAQATGLSLTEIASILNLRSAGEGTCSHVVELLERHLEDLDRHIDNLQATRRQLVSLTERAKGPPQNNIRGVVWGCGDHRVGFGRVFWGDATSP
ncbi:MAG: heavy metal-responsive transcriptional regulator [Actinomycetota bacterium]|nr:heavy metal-responsive transcriptional regulator [Actinomycetota bacterium]